MSGWGNLDNVTLSGNVTVANNGQLVTGFGGAVFTGNVEAGDYIFIGGLKYSVANVTSDTTLYITTPKTGASANVKAYIQQGPKYISNVQTKSNVYMIRNVIGVDVTEAANVLNKARGINQPGWAHTITYTDANNQTRRKTETLVAMSKNFNENSAGSLQQDAADDDVAEE